MLLAAAKTNDHCGNALVTVGSLQQQELEIGTLEAIDDADPFCKPKMLLRPGCKVQSEVQLQGELCSSASRSAHKRC